MGRRGELLRLLPLLLLMLERHQLLLLVMLGNIRLLEMLPEMHILLLLPLQGSTSGTRKEQLPTVGTALEMLGRSAGQRSDRATTDVAHEREHVWASGEHQRRLLANRTTHRE